MLQHLLEHQNFGPGWSCIPKSERATIALLARLNKIKGCPLSLYDEVISWVQEHLQSDSMVDSDDNIVLFLSNATSLLDLTCNRFTLLQLSKLRGSYSMQYESRKAM